MFLFPDSLDDLPAHPSVGQSLQNLQEDPMVKSHSHQFRISLVIGTAWAVGLLKSPKLFQVTTMTETHSSQLANSPHSSLVSRFPLNLF